MALDRTWFDMLVDDDGSNAVGTIWSKAQVDALMDAVDAELLRLDPTQTGYTPQIFNHEGTPMIVAGTTTLQCAYGQVGGLVFVQLYANNLNNPAPSMAVYIQNPPTLPQIALFNAGIVSINRAGVNDFGIAFCDVAGYTRVFPGGVSTWPAGSVSVYGQLFYPIR